MQNYQQTHSLQCNAIDETQPPLSYTTQARLLGLFSTALGSMLFLALGAVQAEPVQAQTLQALYNFTGGSDGGEPYGQPYVDKGGNIFGTANMYGPDNAGTIWEVHADGAFKLLHGFVNTDGKWPYSNLAVNVAGTMFGVASEGGINYDGTAYSIDRKGNFKLLYKFTGSPDAGAGFGGVVLDQSGNIYGNGGGGAYGKGAVWKVNADGSDTVLYSFTGGSDGEHPFYGNLYRDKDGDLFGVAEWGGDENCDCGVLFQIDTTGTYKVLHTFTGGKDGSGPIGAVLRDKDYVYGTANTGGSNGAGTLWKYNLVTGKLKVLYSFSTSDGTFPMGLACQLKDADRAAPACVEGGSGQPVLYGTSPTGGANGEGTLWELDSTGQFKKLWDFGHWNGTYFTDGTVPISPPFIDSTGNAYGTATTGGPYNVGTVWKFTP